ncbi:MAG: hypothetical protein ABI690_28655 [Chloroflexota bacterium]
MAVKPVSPLRPDPPRRPWFARQFAFTSALPLSECAARLEAADQMPTGCFNPPIFVTVQPETDGIIPFHMSVETRVGKGWVIGTLRSVDGFNTQLSGEFGAGNDIILFAVLMLILAPIVIYAQLSTGGSSVSSGVVIGLSIFLLVLFLAIFWYNLYWARSKLFKVFEQILKP